MIESRAPHTLARLRQLLLLVFLAGVVGTGLELVLLEHWEEWTQAIPLAVLGVGAVSAVAALIRPVRRVVQLFLVTAGLFLGGGALGLILHYRGNVEFELEMRPAMGGVELVKEALTGATPALAPGSMALLGLIGLLYGYRNPTLRRARRAGEDA